MSNINIDEVLGAFSYARCDDYHSWLSVGLALYNEGYGCNVWDSWSRQSPKYRSGDCAVKWATFASESNSKVGVGSLLQWAKDDGYKITKTTYLNNDNYIVQKPKEIPANIELKKYLQAVFKAGDTTT